LFVWFGFELMLARFLLGVVFSVALFGGLLLLCMICGWVFGLGFLLVLVEDSDCLLFAWKSFC